MQTIQQAVIRPTVLTLPALSDAAKYRPLAVKMLTWAGIDEDATSLEKARAVVGWIAAHAVHPASTLHPTGTTANLDVLPSGQTWATFNAEFDNGTNIARDNAYWGALFPNGRSMIEALVGTVATDGSVTDNGMLTEYATGAWRIRNFAGFRAVQCTWQCKMAQVLLAALGIFSTDITSTAHDPMMFHENETGRWLYIDPTWGEMYQAGGKLLSPFDMLSLSVAGLKDTLSSQKLNDSGYPVTTYFAGLTNGMEILSIYAKPQWSGGLPNRTPYKLPGFTGQSGDITAAASALMPEYGCGITGLARIGESVEVRMRSSWPGHVGFERSDDGGATWDACESTDYPIGPGTFYYRSVDAAGFSGKSAIVVI